MKCLYDRLKNCWSFFILNIDLGLVHERCKALENKKRFSLNNKIVQLRRVGGANKPDVHTFYNPVLNFSNIDFSEVENGCLALGLKYRPENSSQLDKLKCLEKLAVGTETIVQSMTIPRQGIINECELVLRSELNRIETDRSRKNNGFYNENVI